MDTLTRYFETQTSLLRLQQREREGKEALKQAKFDLRSADEALDALGIPFALGGYYESPVAYLVSAAAKHNRLDRVNQALNQVGAIRKQIQNWK